MRRDPGLARFRPAAASGPAGHHAARQSADLCDDRSRHHAAATIDRVNSRRDRQERRITHRNEAENTRSEAVAYNPFAECHVGGVVDLDAAEPETTVMPRAQKAVELAWVVSPTASSGMPPMLLRRVDRCLLCQRGGSDILAISESRKFMPDASDITRI
jgi:hypothetical protein